ncbi:MAG TPA: thermonuclease family protein [Pyrinomonadaceae bacterium]
MRIILNITLLALFAATQPGCGRALDATFDAAPDGGQARQEARQEARQTITGEVVAVADGDTITVLDTNRRQYRVRLAGIDAPESGQDFGQASKKNLSAAVFGKAVEVSYSKLDRYGRVLGIVRLGGRDINLAQVEAGLAWHYKEYADEQTAEDRERYAAAETRARGERAGLWQQADPVKPSEFRRGKRN